MNSRRLGRTGLKVSEICLGTMTFAGQCDEETSFRILDAAADRGVDFLDTADCYPIPPEIHTAGATERLLGRWLARRPDRDRFVVATKCRVRTGPGPNDQGLSRRHIARSCEDSLKRLRVDAIDLYQAHSPDPDTPLDETLAAFDDLVRAGKVRYVGCSNYPAWQLALALGLARERGWARYDCVQPRYNLLQRDPEAELLPLCREMNVGVIAYNPLAGGFLTGKHHPGDAPDPSNRFGMPGSGELYRRRYWHGPLFDAVETLRALARERETAPATLAVAWVLRRPGITSAIVGASRPEQLEATLAAVDLQLDDDALEVCDRLWDELPRRPGPR